MKTKQELINHYEKQLQKVINFYKNDWRKEECIKHAEEQLEAVRNGREW